MSKTLARDVDVTFSAVLRELRCEKVEEAYDAESFGDEILVFESRDLRLRFVKDRGDIYVDVAPTFEPESWILLEDALELAGTVLQSLPTNRLPKMTTLATSLKTNFELVRRMFTTDNFGITRQKINALREQRLGEIRHRLSKEKTA